MLPLRLVLDTNIVVSAALKPDGLQRTVLTLAMAPPARLYFSAPIFEEYRRVLARPRLHIAKSHRQRLLQLLTNRGHLAAPARRLDVTADPEDNMFLECAEAARADYLITGNLRHFPRFWRQTKIITARELLTIAAPHLIRCPRVGPGDQL